MNSHYYKLIAIIAVLSFSISACYIPGLQPAPAEVGGNLTLTAFYHLLETSQPGDDTATLVVQQNATTVPTLVKLPSATSEPIQPSSTTAPTTAPTSTPTEMPTPTVSFSGPGMRSGTSIAADYLNNPPNINGYLGDWDEGIYPASEVVYGSANRTDNPDLSSTVMVGWNEAYLFVGARVKDSQYVQNANGENIFKGDSVEILLDTDVGSDFYYNYLSVDDYQLGVSPGSPKIGDNAEAYLWFPKSISGNRSQVKIGVLETSNGYHIELAIPWSVFNVSPYEGQHLGFAFSVSDNDTLGTTEQQSMISNVATRLLSSPMTWGDLTLVK